MAFFKSNEFKKATQEQDDKIDYEIDCPTPSKYNLKLIMHADAKLLNLVWDKSKLEVLRKRGMDVRKARPEDIKIFEAPQSYYKFIKVSIRKIWQNCARDFAKEGIVLLSYDVIKCTFKLTEKKGWDVHIEITGIYTKK
jgi:hypothetical protein